MCNAIRSEIKVQSKVPHRSGGFGGAEQKLHPVPALDLGSGVTRVKIS